MSGEIDEHYGYRTVWECEAPPMGLEFQVLRDEWNEEGTERRIYEIRSRGAADHSRLPGSGVPK